MKFKIGFLTSQPPAQKTGLSIKVDNYQDERVPGVARRSGRQNPAGAWGWAGAGGLTRVSQWLPRPHARRCTRPVTHGSKDVGQGDLSLVGSVREGAGRQGVCSCCTRGRSASTSSTQSSASSVSTSSTDTTSTFNNSSSSTCDSHGLPGVKNNALGTSLFTLTLKSDLKRCGDFACRAGSRTLGPGLGVGQARVCTGGSQVHIPPGKTNRSIKNMNDHSCNSSSCFSKTNSLSSNSSCDSKASTSSSSSTKSIKSLFLRRNEITSSINSGRNNEKSGGVVTAGGGSVTNTNIVVVGDKAVGKSAVTVRFLTRRYIGEYSSDTEMMYAHSSTVDHLPAHLHLLDATTQAPHQVLRHLPWAHAFVVVYDVTNRTSFVHARQLLHALHYHPSPQPDAGGASQLEILAPSCRTEDDFSSSTSQSYSMPSPMSRYEHSYMQDNGDERRHEAYTHPNHTSFTYSEEGYSHNSHSLTQNKHQRIEQNHGAHADTESKVAWCSYYGGVPAVASPELSHGLHHDRQYPPSGESVNQNKRYQRGYRRLVHHGGTLHDYHATQHLSSQAPDTHTCSNVRRKKYVCDNYNDKLNVLNKFVHPLHGYDSAYTHLDSPGEDNHVLYPGSPGGSVGLEYQRKCNHNQYTGQKDHGYPYQRSSSLDHSRLICHSDLRVHNCDANELSNQRQARRHTTLLLGNKRDLEHCRVVWTDEGEALSLEFSCQFYEVSAAESLLGVHLAFHSLLKETRAQQYINSLPQSTLRTSPKGVVSSAVSKVIGNFFTKAGKKSSKKRQSNSI